MKSTPKKRLKIVFPERFTIGTPSPKPDYTVQKPKLEISQGEDGLWYWTLISKNGNILAACVTGYTSQEGCRKAQARVSRNMREAKAYVLDLEE